MKTAILKIRQAIRSHRDQRGDDRCWVDDYSVWKLLADTSPEPTAPPPYEKAMACCRAFYRYRRSENADPVPSEAITDPARWDDDLASMPEAALASELQKLQSAIRHHRGIKDRPLTLDDDRALYEALPEKLPADFRLPPEDEFIGGIKPGSGCPNFWKSHGACKGAHDLHHWGPCKP